MSTRALCHRTPRVAKQLNSPLNDGSGRFCEKKNEVAFSVEVWLAKRCRIKQYHQSFAERCLRFSGKYTLSSRWLRTTEVALQEFFLGSVGNMSSKRMHPRSRYQHSSTTKETA